jgi:uncharacterized protein YndB with AHSA1/START domain
MSVHHKIVIALLVGVGLGGGLASASYALLDDAPKAWTPSGFTFELEVAVPGPPAEVFAAFTGDVLPWWDHHFSAQPREMFIEAKPGGSFMEIFDDVGNGVQHARVTGVEHGKMLRMVGPLGAAGRAAEFEMTFTFAADGENTKLHATVHGYGNVDDKTAAAVQGVWKHFLFEQFEPYVKSGKHKSRK